MSTAIRRIACVLLILPCFAIGGCAVTVAGAGFDPAMGYGVGVNALASSDIDPYTLEPYGTNPYLYGTGGLDPYGYPVAEWYGGYGDASLGYEVAPAAVFPSSVAALGGTPAPGHEIHPHTGPSPRLGIRMGPVTRAGVAAP